MDFKDLLKFLTKLKKNNNKDWFDKNREEFENLKLNYIGFLGNIVKELSKHDPGVQETDPKKAFFRMNRDVRFSKDKTPYKTNFGAFIKQGGKKSPFAGYYIHVEPGQSFLAGGVYLPESAILEKIRKGIDYEGDELKKLVSSATFKKYFNSLGGDQLKNPPKGFDPDHPHLEYLKYKSYLMQHQVADKELISEDFQKKTVTIFKAMIPLNNFLNRSIRYEEDV